MTDFLQNGINFLGPHERLGILVIGMDVIIDCLNQFGRAVKRTAVNAFTSDFTEPPLDQVQPRRTGGREMQMKPGMFIQPLMDVVMVIYYFKNVVSILLKYFRRLWGYARKKYLTNNFSLVV